MTFGGMWTFFNAQAAMLEFGFPARIRMHLQLALSKWSGRLVVLSSVF